MVKNDICKRENIRIDAGVHARLKAFAAMDGKKLYQAAEEAILEYIARRS